MGSDRGSSDESPLHRVWVDSFLIDRYEVSQEQYERLVGENPSCFPGPGGPVDTVNWADAALYCNLRSLAEGLEPCYDEESWKCDFEATGYRLPTEAEWEYACRAGTNTSYSFEGDAHKLSQYGWFKENSSKKTHAVGRKKPNAWRLFDMHGNVSEWCNDVYSKTYYKTSPPRNPRGPENGETGRNSLTPASSWYPVAGSHRQPILPSSSTMLSGSSNQLCALADSSFAHTS